MSLLVEKLPGKKRTGPPEREIVAALRKVAKVAGPDDLVIVFLSGHGDCRAPRRTSARSSSAPGVSAGVA
jgi:hypothetical protein